MPRPLLLPPPTDATEPRCYRVECQKLIDIMRDLTWLRVIIHTPLHDVSGDRYFCGRLCLIEWLEGDSRDR